MKKVFAITLLTIFLLITISCSNSGEEENQIDLVGVLEKEAENLSIDDKSLEIGCEFTNPACDSNHSCINNTCIRKDGCQYDNPSCPDIQNCIDNQCYLKQGCEYDNPVCKTGHSCIDNKCIYAVGCNWDNPSCSEFEDCENNECVPQKGCANDNPPCDWGQSCQGNVCIGTASGVLHDDDFNSNRHWSDMQDVNESGVDLGTQKD